MLTLSRGRLMRPLGPGDNPVPRPHSSPPVGCRRAAMWRHFGARLEVCMATRYGDFRPTTLDTRGLGLPDQQDWLVVPASQTRDSGTLARANFRSALEILGGESDTVEVHRFGHWGPGWFELILVHPSREAEVEKIENALEYYPVLDDSLYSDMESAQEMEDWDTYGESDFRHALKRHFTLSDATCELLMGVDGGTMYEFHREQSNGGEPWRDGEGFDFTYVRDIERDTLAAWLWKLRRDAKAA